MPQRVFFTLRRLSFIRLHMIVSDEEEECITIDSSYWLTFHERLLRNRDDRPEGCLETMWNVREYRVKSDGTSSTLILRTSSRVANGPSLVSFPHACVRDDITWRSPDIFHNTSCKTNVFLSRRPLLRNLITNVCSLRCNYQKRNLQISVDGKNKINRG